MGYAVFRASKGKGSGGGLGSHIDRTKGKEHTYKHADPSRTHLNVNYSLTNNYHKKPLNQAVSERIEQGYKGKRKLRNDAVKYLKHIYTGSPEEMKKIFSEPGKAKAWVKANSEFLIEEFGRENIVRFTLHLDEKTPHLHAVTVPLTKDGRLSAKEIMGNKKNLELRQDRYAEKMKPFGLERGIRGTGIKHENANDYYKRIGEAEKMASKNIPEPIKGVFGIDKQKTIDNLQNVLKSSNLALFDLKEKNKRAQIIAKERNNRLKAERSLTENWKNRANTNAKAYNGLNKTFKETVLSPEKTARLRANLEKQQLQKKNRDKNRGRSM